MPSPGGAALPSLPCLPSPTLLLWDPPCATRSWDPGSRINEQIETDAGHGTDTFNEMPHAVLAVCVCVCVCALLRQRCNHVSVFFFYFGDAHCYLLSVELTCAAGWLTSAGNVQDVQQHGQDCRCQKDGRAAETGGQHREDDGEWADDDDGTTEPIVMEKWRSFVTQKRCSPPLCTLKGWLHQFYRWSVFKVEHYCVCEKSSMKCFCGSRGSCM